MIRAFIPSWIVSGDTAESTTQSPPRTRLAHPRSESLISDEDLDYHHPRSPRSRSRSPHRGTRAPSDRHRRHRSPSSDTQDLRNEMAELRQVVEGMPEMLRTMLETITSTHAAPAPPSQPIIIRDELAQRFPWLDITTLNLARSGKLPASHLYKLLPPSGTPRPRFTSTASRLADPLYHEQCCRQLLFTPSRFTSSWSVLAQLLVHDKQDSHALLHSLMTYLQALLNWAPTYLWSSVMTYHLLFAGPIFEQEGYAANPTAWTGINDGLIRGFLVCDPMASCDSFNSKIGCPLHSTMNCTFAHRCTSCGTGGHGAHRCRPGGGGYLTGGYETPIISCQPGPSNHQPAFLEETLELWTPQG